MSDPVAEAAAQLAALSVANMAETDATTPFMEKFAAQLAASQTQATPPVEVPNVPAVAGASATAPATAELPNADAGTQPAGAAIDAAGDSGNVAGAAVDGALATGAVVADGGDSPNAVAVAPAATSGAAASDTASETQGDLPNAASVAVEPTTALGSASNAAGASITSTIGASSGEPPLHILIAQHLEAIYKLAKTSTAPAGPDTSALKIRVGDVLFRISNGMAVSEGDMVQKLEALYRAL